MGTETVARHRHPEARKATRITNREFAIIVQGAISSRTIKDRYYRVVGVAAVAQAIREGAKDAVSMPSCILNEAVAPKRLVLRKSAIALAWTSVGSYLHHSMAKADVKLRTHG